MFLKNHYACGKAVKKCEVLTLTECRLNNERFREHRIEMFLGCKKDAKTLSVFWFLHQPHAQIVRLIQQNVPFVHVTDCLQFQECSVRIGLGHVHHIIIEFCWRRMFILIAMLYQIVDTVLSNLFVILLIVVQLLRDCAKQTRCISSRVLAIETF